MFKSTTGLMAVAFAAMASASVNIQPFPQATGAMALPNADWANQIEPTAAPAPPGRYARGSLDFAERADPSNILVAPDATCGYISGRQGAEYTCVGDYTCALFPASATSTGNVACCNSAACNIRKACINYEEYHSSSACDDACRVDGYTVKCLNTDYPYCNTVSFSGSIFDYWCNGISMSTPQGVQTTFDGQKRVFKTSDLSDASETLTITDNTSQAGVTVTVVPSATSTNDPGNSDNSNNNSKKKDSGAPIGAIVGGVVGGVAAIAIAALAIWWFLRKKKNTPPAAAAVPAAGPGVPPQQPSPAATYSTMGQVPPQAGGYGQNSFYDPKFVAAGGVAPGTAPYNPQGNYPQNGSYYPAPSAYAPSTTATSPTVNNAVHMGNTPSPSNPHPGFVQPPVIHEAPATAAEQGRDERHELA